jgi:hypothetical protein
MLLNTTKLQENLLNSLNLLFPKSHQQTQLIDKTTSSIQSSQQQSKIKTRHKHRSVDSG